MDDKFYEELVSPDTPVFYWKQPIFLDVKNSRILEILEACKVDFVSRILEM